MTFSINRLVVSERWISLGMLLTLHLALWAGVESIWSRPFLFAHFGLFLMWQPLWRGEEKLSTRSSAIIIGASVLAMVWLNWWILAFWVSGLFALVGGRVFAFQSIWQRLRYLLVMGYLLADMLVWLTPQLFMLSAAVEASKDLMQVVLPLLLVVMVLMPHETERLQKTQAVDLIYSLLLFMMLTLLVLGSLAFMSLGHATYFNALLRTLFSMALLLFVLGWLSNPRMGFAGFQAISSRYFLNIGTPFELWLKQLAKTAQHENSPHTFLDIAAGHLAELPWLSGLTWECEGGKGAYGARSPHFIDVADHDLHLKIFTRQRMAPTMLMHIHLLSQMLAFFYQTKRREQRLREMVLLQAVHETGARLTHDLKNMMQYLLTLISIARQQPAQAQHILQNQLPELAQRIELILGKLKVPQEEVDMSTMPLAAWWQKLQQRHQYRDLQWEYAGSDSERLIPLALFDSIADNLIDNARNKRMRESSLKVTVSLRSQPLILSVCDSGVPIPEDVAAKLLHTVVDSEDGLGIGLFQAARWAEQSGFRLLLQENRAGRVSFELTERIT